MTGEYAPQCQIWWARRHSASYVPVDLFNDEERDRYVAYRHAADADRFAVGVWLSRTVLGGLLGCAPREVELLRDCPSCGRPHGRPRLAAAGPTISISHSGDLVVMALCRTHQVGIDVQECGVDVPSPDGVMSPRELTAHRVLAPNRRRYGFFTTWVRKEAVLKATGDGLNFPLADLEVTGSDRAAGVIACRGRPDLTVGLCDLPAPEGYAAAVAVLAARYPRLDHRDGDALLSTGGSTPMDDLYVHCGFTMGRDKRL